MDKYWVINKDGFISNCIVWDGISPYDASDNTLLSCTDNPDINFGWSLVDGVWVAPPVADTPES
jgi:hypothetical protein